MTPSHKPSRLVPESVYLDTVVVAAAMFPGALHHNAAREFCEVLVNASSRIVISGLLRVEFLQALVSIGNDPGQLSASVRRRFALHRWGDLESVRLTWLQQGTQLLHQFLSQFAEVSEAEIAESIVAVAIPVMARYQLRSYDAVHIATAQVLGIAHFATCDADFLRLNGNRSLTIRLLRDS